MRSRGRITRAGLGAVLIALLMIAAGLMKTINLLILLGDLFLVLVALNAWLAYRSTRSLKLVAGEPQDLFAGADTTRTVAVANPTARMQSIHWKETSAVHDASAFLAAIPPAATERVRFAIQPSKRGVHPITASFASSYPFGFIAFERQVESPEPLTVFPAVGRIDREAFRRWLQQGGASESRSRRAVANLSPQVADIRGVRPFRSGESLRHIHWRTSARRNDLMVRDYDSPDSVDLVLVVETWLPMKPEADDVDRLESAVSLAATLLKTWCHGESSPRITLHVSGRTDAIEGRASPTLARQLLRSLAAVNGQSEWGIESQVLRGNSPRAVHLLISSRPDAGPLMKFLSQSTGRQWQRLSPMIAPAWYHPPQPHGA